MKKGDVKVGSVYAVKVSDKVVPVRIEREHPNGGWLGTNQETGREVRVKSAQRIRGAWHRDSKAVAALDTLGAAVLDSPGAAGGRKGEEKAEAKPKDAKAPKKAPRAKTGAHGEPSAKPPRKASGERRPSGLDAAAKVLEEAGEALSCKAIVERAFEKGYWKSGGKTPHATVYSAILREIQKKGEQARFRKAARGRFEVVKK